MSVPQVVAGHIQKEGKLFFLFSGHYMLLYPGRRLKSITGSKPKTCPIQLGVIARRRKGRFTAKSKKSKKEKKARKNGSSGSSFD
jgi:hypothetical protein